MTIILDHTDNGVPRGLAELIFAARGLRRTWVACDGGRAWLPARRTPASCTDHAAGTGVHTPDGPSRARRGRPRRESRSRVGGGSCPAYRVVRPAHACGEEPERSGEERSGGPGAQRRAPWLRRRRQWQRRVSECQAIAGNRAAGTQTGRGGAPPLRGHERVPRVDRGLERGSEGRKRGLRAPWAAGGEWERGPPRPTDARARDTSDPRGCVSAATQPGLDPPAGGHRESLPSSRRCGRSGSGRPRTPLLSPRGSPDARGLAASVLNPHRRVAAGKETIVERPRVTLHEGPCEGDSNRKVGVHT
ncbi:hypothetical protein ACRRTK_005423 [Alexandromys fortis]